MTTFLICLPSISTAARCSSSLSTTRLTSRKALLLSTCHFLISYPLARIDSRISSTEGRRSSTLLEDRMISGNDNIWRYQSRQNILNDVLSNISICDEKQDECRRVKETLISGIICMSYLIFGFSSFFVDQILSHT